MTKIENKETSLFLTEDVKVKYSDLLAAIINTPVKQGISLKEMREDLALLDKVENMKLASVGEFSDEDIAKIKTLTENHLWGVRHADFITFADYIESL